MLHYKPPFLEAGDLTIFTDDKDEEVFYYACNRPAILKNNSGQPNMEAFALLGSGGSTGTGQGVLEASLMVDVGLHANEAQLELAKKAIQKNWAKQARVLVPVPVHSGKVFLIMAAAGEEPDPTKWFVTEEVKSSILGDNNASLVVRATGKDAQLLVAALNSDVVAASVHYELEIPGIAPVFKANMEVNWKSVYSHFEQFDKTNAIFYTDEITETVDKLEEAGAINVHIEELDPVIKSEAMKSLLNDLKAEVIKKLFQPASTPLGASSKWEDRLANGVSRVVATLAIGSHHILRKVDESKLSTTSVNLSQRNVKLYPHNPQALLPTLINEVGGIKEKIRWIKLDEIPFIEQPVELRVAADSFGNTNIKNVLIECRIIDDSGAVAKDAQQFIFDSDEKNQASFSFIRNKENQYKYQFKPTIFVNTVANALPDKLELEWQTKDEPYLYFAPAAYFVTKELTISVDDSSVFDHAALVEAELIVSSGTTEVLKRTYLFKSGQVNPGTLNVLTTKADPLRFDINLVYYVSAAKEIKASYPNVETQYFFVPNPFENKWSVDVISQLNWEVNSKAILEVSIEDKERPAPIVLKYDLTQQAPDIKIGVATSLDTPPQLMQYRVSCIAKDATVKQSSWSRHEGPILVVKEPAESERTISVTLKQAPDFEREEIRSVTVAFIYEDAANNLKLESDAIPFNKTGDTVTFRHPLKDINKKDFRYQVRARSRRGDTYKTEWTNERKDNLDVILPNKLW